MSKLFKDNDYSVVYFDTTNTFGESEGNYEDATTTNYYEDLEDVIAWATEQEWYQEPFILMGHSLGGISTALYAENYPNKVKAVAPISTVVSGELSALSRPSRPEEQEEWKKTGWRVSKSESKPGVIKRLKWSHMEDRLKYDLLPNADKLVMPVLLIVGEEDESTPPVHQKILYNKLSGQKQLEIIQGAPHTFRDEDHLDKTRKILDTWLKSL